MTPEEAVHHPVLRPIAPRRSVPATPLTVPAQIDGGFWADRQRINSNESIREGWVWLERSGSFVNFATVARGGGGFLGEANQDAETYKWVEAAAFEVARNPDDSELRGWLDQAVDVILTAQEPSGYLHTWHQLHPDAAHFDGIDHGGPDETYTGGHFLHAAVAHARSTGETRMTDAALRLARHLEAEYFSADSVAVSGHPGIEMALVELYRQTGEPDILDLADCIVRRRGHGWLGGHRFGSSHYQDYAPIEELPVLTGHAVAGLYLMSGATDVAIETGDSDLLAALESIWERTVERRMHITGGIGSRGKNEDVGDDYELNPDSAYCETCASIALVMWSWRLLVATGRMRYADVMERALLNGVLVGVGRDGRTFRYDNPLQVRDGHRTPAEISAATRAEWFELACCPPNLMRLIASIGHYVATVDGEALTLLHFMDGIVPWGDGFLDVSTQYPWSGEIEITYRGPARERTLRVRRPSWAAAVTLDGAEPAVDTLDLRRRWSDGDTVTVVIEFAPRWTVAHPGVDALRGAVALENGPIVYCVEQVDTIEQVDRLRVDPPSADLCPSSDERGFVTLSGTALVEIDWESPLYRPWSPGGVGRSPRTAPFTAVPYMDWGNRGAGAMRVWLPLGGIRQ
jgi:DUF1680 family protein